MPLPLAITIHTELIIAVHFSEEAQAMVAAEVEKCWVAAAREGELLLRTYHLRTRPTASRDYDDRLSVRLGKSRKTLLAQLNRYRSADGRRGGLRFAWAGRYVVSEQACRE